MLLAECLDQQLSGFPQHPVAFLMAPRIVDLLEVVQVQHHHRDLMALIGIIILPQGHAVPVPGQRVDQGNALELLVLPMELVRQGLHLIEGLHLRSLQKADQQHIRGDPDERHEDLLHILRRKMDKAVICREEKQRIGEHDDRRHDAAAEAEQGRAEDKARDQDHIRVGDIAGIHKQDQDDHDPRCDSHFIRQTGLQLQKCSFS